MRVSRGKLFAWSLPVCVVLACAVEDATVDSAGSGEDATTEAGSDGDEVVDGEELYWVTCSPCHGPEAEGTGRGYELRHPPREFATWVVRHGRPGLEFPLAEMLPYAESALTEDELTAILDYLDSFPQPTTGEALFLDYCANCHGDDASGGSVRHGVRGASASDLGEIVRRGHDGTNYGKRSGYMPAFDDTRLSDDELEAIAEFLGTI